ncbi:Protein of unknown function [Spirosomataceae bacterium TFI 002]|nr:Protein of unknown function [Spirosomataceae bacterium TFI 002]
MSKFAECMELYKAQNAEYNMGLSETLLTAVAKGLGPSIYNPDSSKVSGSDQSEVDRVKTNFLIKKLGLADGPSLEPAIREVLEKLGTSNRSKYRAVVYAALAVKFSKEGVYA